MRWLHIHQTLPPYERPLAAAGAAVPGSGCTKATITVQSSILPPPFAKKRAHAKPCSQEVTLQGVRWYGSCDGTEYEQGMSKMHKV